MGATGWHYFTPYQADAEAALQHLREGVFARREYSFGFGGFGGPDAPMPGAGGDPASLFTAASHLGGQEARVMRAAMSGDYEGLTAEERRAAEQLRPMFQMFGAAAQAHHEDEDEDEDEDEEGDEGDDYEPRNFPPGHQPTTIDELLEMVAEDGTHSILDIERTARRPEFGAATPMPPDRIQAVFGTTQPTHAQVEELWLDVADELDRWEAYYLTVYRDGTPHEYAFIGCSGD